MTAPQPAVPGLLARYRAVLRMAWVNRHALAGPRRQRDELAFLPAALSLQHTPVHPAPRLAAAVLMALFVIALCWAWLGKVDIVAVAPGRIIVGERSKLVQPLERSVVKRVLVQDGDRVQVGQALVELDATSAHADKANLHEQLRTTVSESVRARSLLQGLPTAPPHLPATTFPSDWSLAERQSADAQLAAEWNDISARLARFAAEARRREAEVTTAREIVGKLDATLPLSRQRETDIRSLVGQGFVAAHAGQDRTRERIELERDLGTQQARLDEAMAALAESGRNRAAYLAETTRNLHERIAAAELRRQQVGQEHTKASQREKLTVLSAPVSGTVQQLAAHTAGGVVTEAQALMVIVPDGGPGEQLVAEVALENKDIGFVTIGQNAQIKLETFPFTRFGTIAATVQMVTADAVTDEKRGAIFPARLLLATNRIDVEGKLVRLTPGMNLSAEIKTGQRRVIDFLLSPVQRASQESLRER